MQSKTFCHGFKLTAALVILLAPLARMAAQAPNPAMQPYIGHWVGQGWGSEERFRQSEGEFVQQFPGAKSVPGKIGTDQTVMSLIVRHDARYDFRVDEQGNITGQGEITYDLLPNLCGVAALTKQVNEQVNMMSMMPTILKAATAIGKEAVLLENKEFFNEETELAEKIEQVEGAVERAEHQGLPQKSDYAMADTMMRQLMLSNNQPADVRQLVSAIIWKNCFDPQLRITGSEPACLDLLVRPLAKEAEYGELFKEVFEVPLDLIYDNLKEKSKEFFESLDEHSEQEAAACSGTGDALAAGTKVGPSNTKELIQEMGPALAKGYLDSAMGSAPAGLLLSIPGVTQVQYYYKGLTKGPESRSFKLKGHLVPAGKGAKLYLKMDGEVTGGDKNLHVEYMVNYKKEVRAFPTWSPFLDAPADAQPSGIEPLYYQKSGQGGKPTTARIDLVVGVPFASLHEMGSQRKGVKVWHDYEYFWNAWKIMEPVPAKSKP